MPTGFQSSIAKVCFSLFTGCALFFLTGCAPTVVKSTKVAKPKTVSPQVALHQIQTMMHEAQRAKAPMAVDCLRDKVDRVQLAIRLLQHKQRMRSQSTDSEVREQLSLQITKLHDAIGNAQVEASRCEGRPGAYTEKQRSAGLHLRAKSKI